MKALQKLKLNKFSELDCQEMKKLKGSMMWESFVVCVTKKDSEGKAVGCSDATAGQFCRTSGFIGNCAFVNMYSAGESFCDCFVKLNPSY